MTDGGGDGRHGHDASTAVAHQLGRGVLDGEEGADHVDVDGGPELVDARGHQRPHVRRAAGAGDGHAQPARRIGGDGHGGDHVVFGGDVGRHRPHRAAQLLEGGVETLLAAAADGDDGAVGRQTLGGGKPDATAAAGDQGALPVEDASHVWNWGMTSVPMSSMVRITVSWEIFHGFTRQRRRSTPACS